MDMVLAPRHTTRGQIQGWLQGVLTLSHILVCFVILFLWAAPPPQCPAPRPKENPGSASATPPPLGNLVIWFLIINTELMKHGFTEFKIHL